MHNTYMCGFSYQLSDKDIHDDLDIYACFISAFILFFGHKGILNIFVFAK